MKKTSDICKMFRVTKEQSMKMGKYEKESKKNKTNSLNKLKTQIKQQEIYENKIMKVKHKYEKNHIEFSRDKERWKLQTRRKLKN